MKKNLKKLMALLAVFVMMVSLITVPNASAHAAEGSGSYDTTNTWWGGGSYMTCYAAADSTVRIQEETSQATNYWPEGGFPWFSAIVLDANEDGNYVVTEIVPDDGTNDKGSIALTTGRLVIVYHDAQGNADSVAFFDSLVVGDVLKAKGLWGDYVPTWETLAEGGDVATFTKVVEEEVVEHNLVHVDAVEPGCHYEGNIEHWYCLDCETVWSDEALTQITNHKSVVVPALGGEVTHVEAVEPTATVDGNIEYWFCEECEQVWQDEALTQLTNIKNVVVPATGEVEEPEMSGSYDTTNTWWGGGSYMTCYAAVDSTVRTQEETSQATNYWPEGGFPWFSAIVLDANEDGNYVVTEIVPDDGTNDKGDIALTTGRLVIVYHDANGNPDSVAFFDSLVVGDVLKAKGLWGDYVPTWESLAEGADVATFTKVVEEEVVEHNLVHVDAVEPGCHYDGNIEHWYCLDCETVWADEALTQITNHKSVVIPATGSENLVHFPAVEAGCHYDGCIEYWYCPDCEGVWQDEALTQVTNHKNIVVPALGGEVIHVEAVEPTATEDGNIEYWYCEDCEQVWQDEALTQLTNIKNVVIPATGEEEVAGATATFANGYDWNAQVNQIYIFASEEEEASISSLTGQDAATFQWFHTVVLEENEDGTYTVAAAGFGKDTGAIGAGLGEGKVILMAHDTTSYVDSFNYLLGLAVGDVVAMDTTWADLAAKYAEAVEINIGAEVEEPEQPEDPEQPCDHEGVIYFEAVEPACHFMGNVEYWFCPDCEGFWTDEALTQVTNSKRVNLPALGGEVIHMEALAPACHSIGNIEHWYCEECEQVWQDEALTQLTNHKNVILAATGSENIKHVEAVEPTATENGNVEYWYCADCDSYYTDEACTQLSNAKRVILPATGEEAPEKAPQTGDNMPVVLMVSILLASMAIVVYGYKKRNA